MFTGIVLICMQGMCDTLMTPLVRTEQECEAVLSAGLAEVIVQFPAATIMAVRCVNWGEDA